MSAFLMIFPSLRRNTTGDLISQLGLIYLFTCLSIVLIHRKSLDKSQPHPLTYDKEPKPEAKFLPIPKEALFQRSIIAEQYVISRKPKQVTAINNKQNKRFMVIIIFLFYIYTLLCYSSIVDKENFVIFFVKFEDNYKLSESAPFD